METNSIVDAMRNIASMTRNAVPSNIGTSTNNNLVRKSSGTEQTETKDKKEKGQEILENIGTNISSFVKDNSDKKEKKYLDQEQEEPSLFNTPWWNMPYEGSENDSPNIRHWKNLNQLDKTFSDNDMKEYRNQAIEKFFTPGAVGSGTQDIPYLADYNGFNFADYEGYTDPGDITNPIGQAYTDMGFSKDAKKEYDAKAADDLEKELIDRYFAETNLGVNYSGIGDFMTRGTYEEWRDFVRSDMLKDLYKGEYEKFGDLNDDNNFENYWNYYKGNNIEDVIQNPDLLGEYITLSGGLINDLSSYLISQGYVDENAARNFGVQYDNYFMPVEGTSDDALNELRKITNYQLTDRLLQYMLNHGTTEDEFLNAASDAELNSLLEADPTVYTRVKDNDAFQTLNEWGKKDHAIHPTEFNQSTFTSEDYGGAPYIGLADTINALAGGKLYHKTRERPVKEDQTNNQE